jgi:hypothetical protein
VEVRDSERAGFLFNDTSGSVTSCVARGNAFGLVVQSSPSLAVAGENLFTESSTDDRISDAALPVPDAPPALPHPGDVAGAGGSGGGPGAGGASGSSGQGGAGGVIDPTACPDPTDPKVHYISEKPSLCDTLKLFCPAPQTLVNDECGCRCLDP